MLDSPRILQEIQAARSAELRLESLNKLGKELLADLPGYDEISSRVTSALKEVERKRQNLVDTWVILMLLQVRQRRHRLSNIKLIIFYRQRKRRKRWQVRN